jgi:hypothetical protein
MADIGSAAVGDGVADDTAALQAAFDRVAQPDSAFSTVYFPPGTYRITREINSKRVDKGATSMHIRGHGRHSRVVWDGPEGGTMFRIASFGNSTYIGTVWDGRGRAARGFTHDGGNETKVLHEHQAFMNFTEQGSGTTKPPRERPDYMEGSEWRNCMFINCGKGWAIWGFNDLVMTINGCEFHDCGYGIWMERGSFYARNSHFERSKQADIWINNDNVGCSVRRCTSVGSHAFFHSVGAVVTTIQDCHVSGWTNPDGAIYNRGRSPLLIFDTVFTDAPSANPPIRLDRPQSVVYSNNTTSTREFFGGSTEHVVEVPNGERKGSVTSARQSFFKSEAAIPTRVFDAKRDFGARGDGRGDDSEAVQRAIDAARQHGRGAIAYLPRGNYRLSKTVHITGRDYYVGGALLSTNVIWAGGDVGPAFLVTDPQNVTMEYLRLRGCTVRQVSTIRQPSRMHYENLRYMTLELVGLSKNSVVTTGCLSACITDTTMLIDNCSSAKILLGYIDISRIHVRGTRGDREGFLGVLGSQAQFLIEDNQSIVGAESYQEQMGTGGHIAPRNFPYAILRGSPTLPAGRVTLSGPKVCGGDFGQTGTPYEEYFTVDNYRGRLSHVLSDYYYPTPTHDPNKRWFKIVCSGEVPIDILLMANQYMGGTNTRGPGDNSHHRTKPAIEGGSSVTPTMLGNWLSHPGDAPFPNVVPPNGLRLAALALDDFRELGELDLELNHTEK